MEHPVKRRAERLLRELGRQAEGKVDPIAEPELAAERLNMEPDSPVTEEALSRLEGSGYLERTQNPALGTTIGAYRLTEEGLAKAEELRGG
jgi:DNA-binding MarR family transcriptional regulator